MELGEETSKEELSSFASLLKTFLPDHSDIPLMGSAEELLQHVRKSMKENSAWKPEESRGHHKGDPNTQGGTKDVSCLKPSEQSSSSNRPSEDIQPCDDQLVSVYKSPRGSNQNCLGSKCQSADDETKLTRQDTDIVVGDGSSDFIKSTFENGGTSKSHTSGNSEKATSPWGLSVNYNKGCLASSSQMDSSFVKRYACFVCDETFEDLVLYTAHIKCHYHKLGHIKCSDCRETLPNSSLFYAHRKLSTYEIWADRLKLSGFQHADTEDSPEEEIHCKRRRKKKDGDEKYVCNICGKTTRKFSSFLKHVRSHKGLHSFSCAVCLEGFPAPCLLRNHIDMQHSHVQPFQCRRCLRRFKLKCSLSTHLRYCDVDPGNLPFAEEMQYIDQLSQQRKYQGLESENDGMSQYSCPICMLMFDSPEDLKSHMSYHDETKPYKCEVCGRGFRSRHVLRKHIPVHETKHERRCEICGVQLLTLSGYNAHLRGHRNQEKIQARFFPELSADTKEESSDAALKLLEKIKSSGVRKIEGVADDVSRDTLLKPPPVKKVKHYKCPICGMLFYSGGVKFQMHARKEHKEAQFEKCKVCNKSYFGQDNLEKHERLHRMFADCYACDECGKNFRRKFALQVHKQMHTFKKFVKCDICGQEFRFVSEVDKHKNKKHRYDRLINIYKCSVCGQKFPMLSHLSVHCYCHNLPGAKPFECDLCKECYQTSTELKKHIFEKHDELMQKLNGATYLSENYDMLRNLPGLDVNGSLELVPPEQSKLSDASSDLDLATTPIGHFSQTDPLKETEFKIEAMNSEDSVSQEEGSLPSNVEAYNLATRQFYHQAKFLKRYICEVCQKAFSSNSDLKTHRRTHSGETPFKCDYCDRSFKQRGHRKLHIQVVHTKEMPYKCDQCDSAFPTRYRYQIHIKRHTGVREHQCPFCEKNFYTLGKLNEHKKKRHAQELALETKPNEELDLVSQLAS